MWFFWFVRISIACLGGGMAWFAAKETRAALRGGVLRTRYGFLVHRADRPLAFRTGVMLHAAIALCGLVLFTGGFILPCNEE